VEATCQCLDGTRDFSVVSVLVRDGEMSWLGIWGGEGCLYCLDHSDWEKRIEGEVIYGMSWNEWFRVVKSRWNAEMFVWKTTSPSLIRKRSCSGNVTSSHQINPLSHFPDNPASRTIILSWITPLSSPADSDENVFLRLFITLLNVIQWDTVKIIFKVFWACKRNLCCWKRRIVFHAGKGLDGGESVQLALFTDAWMTMMLGECCAGQ